MWGTNNWLVQYIASQCDELELLGVAHISFLAQAQLVDIINDIASFISDSKNNIYNSIYTHLNSIKVIPNELV